MLSFSAFSAETQEASKAKYIEATTQESIEKNNISGKDAEISLVFSDDEDSEDSNTISDSSTSSVWYFIRMIFVLAIVIGLIYVLVYFLRRSGKNIANDDPYLKRTAYITVSPGKTVQVITLGSKGYIIGVSDTSVNLIGEVEDSDLINAMNLAADAEPTGKARDFASILAKFTHSASATTNLGLKKQQDRLKNLSSHSKDEL